MKSNNYLFENDMNGSLTTYGQEKLTQLFAYLDKHLGHVTNIHCNSYRRHDGCFFALDLVGEQGKSLSLTLIPDTKPEWADYLNATAPAVSDADIFLADAHDAFKLIQAVMVHCKTAKIVFNQMPYQQSENGLNQKE